MLLPRAYRGEAANGRQGDTPQELTTLEAKANPAIYLTLIERLASRVQAFRGGTGAEALHDNNRLKGTTVAQAAQLVALPCLDAPLRILALVDIGEHTRRGIGVVGQLHC
jgi:hypothetical protein